MAKTWKSGNYRHMKFYQIDAFTNKIFGGNPACVIPLEKWLPNNVLLNLAKESGVSETAFFIDKGEKIHLRWFTPDIEIDLCGHGTLAAAHTLKTILNYRKDKIVFETISGELIVSAEKGMYTLNFPSRPPISVEMPEPIKKALNIQPVEILKSRDYILVYENEQQIRNIRIDRQIFDEINIDPGGVAVTARGDTCDFVSRFFTPQATILEDPVTGSSHCSLIPYWSKYLGKKDMIALQLSERQGQLYCTESGNRVLISGEAITFCEGEIFGL